MRKLGENAEISNDVDLIVTARGAWVENKQFVRNAGIAIKNGVIWDIDHASVIIQRYHANEIFENPSKIILPGLVDAHTHVLQYFLRGFIISQPFMVWTKVLIPYESTLSEEEACLSARFACLEMLRAGITGFADAGGPFPEVVCEVVDEMGLRAAITASIMDEGNFVPQTMKFSPEKAVQRLEHLFNEWNGKGQGRIKIFAGIRQIMTSSPELLKTISNFARMYSTGLHVHLAEDRAEVEFCFERYRCRPVEVFAEYGVFDNHVIAAHCIFISDQDVNILSKNKIYIVHCPAPNLLAQGFPKMWQFKAAGINVSIATDGAAWTRLDLFESMRLMHAATQAYYGLATHCFHVPSSELFRMITEIPAEASMFGTGVIAVGKPADLIMIDLDQPHLASLPIEDLGIIACLYFSSHDVSDVIVNGRILVKNKNVLIIDENEIKERIKDMGIGKICSRILK